MVHTLAVANQKGGVAKTTTVVSIGSAMAEHGLRTLLVDLDAQACLTFSLGIDPDEVEDGAHELLLGLSPAEKVVHRVSGDAGPGGTGVLDLIPATIELAGAESALLGRPGREFALRTALEPVIGGYDVVLLDCSPSLGVLTLAALTAADEVLIPMQCEMLSHRGVGQLLDTIADVQRLLNPRLRVSGILPTMFDSRTSHGRAVLGDIADRYQLTVLSPPIPRTVRFTEAPAVGRSILQTAANSPGAKAYREVAAALRESW